jgi:hypothetical protein
MNGPLIVPIVEGHGEVGALPVLLRRIIQNKCPEANPILNPPIRIKAVSFVGDADYFARYFALAAAKAHQGNGTVLILLDCEDDCPATLGQSLFARAREVRSDVSCLVALACREYETWFLAAASSLAGLHGLPASLVPPASPESIRGAKEWLSLKMAQSYDPVIHQAAFTATFSLDAARSVRSFARLADRVTALVPRRD